MKNIKVSLLIFISFLFYNCKSNSEKFDKDLVNKIFYSINTKHKTSFDNKILLNLIENELIEDIKNGKIIEKEILFEKFNCDCFDSIKISYSKLNDYFELYIYEESFVEELDWCPESSYKYIFKIIVVR